MPLFKDQVQWYEMAVKQLFFFFIFSGRTDSRNLTASSISSICWAGLNGLHISANNNDGALTAESWPEDTGLQPKHSAIHTRFQAVRANITFPKPNCRFPLWELIISWNKNIRVITSESTEMTCSKQQQM